MVVVVEALDSRVPDRAIHPFDLAVGPRMIGFCGPVLEPIGFTVHVKAHLPGVGGVAVPSLLGELDAPRHYLSDQWRSNGSIGQDRVDTIWNGLEQMHQELPRCPPFQRFG